MKCSSSTKSDNSADNSVGSALHVTRKSWALRFFPGVIGFFSLFQVEDENMCKGNVSNVGFLFPSCV